MGPPSASSSASDAGAKRSASPQTLGVMNEALFRAASVSDGPPAAIRMSLGRNSLELMHFYTTETSFTLSNRPELQQIWQRAVPRMAFTHDFLLHGILAFSALHLARQEPERKALLYTEASAHHNIGLKMFRTAICNVTPQNCDACFAFSAIIAAYAWASSDQAGDLFFSDASISDGKSNVEWVSLLRGVHTLLKVAGDWMADGSMKNILESRSLDPEVCRAADPEAGVRLSALSQLWVSSSDTFDLDDLKTLDETLALLQEAWGLVALSASDSKVDTILVVYGWPIKVPEAFFAMIKEQRPEALIVLAHYSLLLNKVDQLWYMQGMSRRLLQTIHSKIGKEWESWIAWPLQDLVLTEFGGQMNSTRVH